MRNVITTIVLLLVFLSTVCSVHAYVYYVEAEGFDPDTSVLSAGGSTWTITEDENRFSGKYMKYSGPHSGANTSLSQDFKQGLCCHGHDFLSLAETII